MSRILKFKLFESKSLSDYLCAYRLNKSFVENKNNFEKLYLFLCENEGADEDVPFIEYIGFCDGEWILMDPDFDVSGSSERYEELAEEHGLPEIDGLYDLSDYDTIEQFHDVFLSKHQKDKKQNWTKNEIFSLFIDEIDDESMQVWQGLRDWQVFDYDPVSNTFHEERSISPPGTKKSYVVLLRINKSKESKVLRFRTTLTATETGNLFFGEDTLHMKKIIEIMDSIKNKCDSENLDFYFNVDSLIARMIFIER